MSRRATAWRILLALPCACLPRAHDVTGHSCQQDTDCGSGFICWKLACARVGTVGTDTVTGAQLASGNDEGAALLGTSVVRSRPGAGVGSWDAGAALPAARMDLATAVADGFVYALGGWDGGGAPVADVVRLSGGWQPEQALPKPRRALAAVAYAQSVYALGGIGADGQPLADVVAAPLAPDGTLGAWKALTSLPSARSGLSAVAQGGFLYALGGVGGTGLLTDVLAAPMRGDGSLGAWKGAGALPAGRGSLGAVAYQGWLYVVGGSCGGGPCGALGARLNPDGTLGPWVALADLPAPRASLGLAAWAGQLIAVGGELSDGTAVAEVDAALLNADGTLGAWVAMPSLPAPARGLAAAAENGTVLALGGTDGTNASARVSTANVLARAVAPWNPSADLNPGRFGASAVVHGGAFYVVSGDLDNGPSITSLLQNVSRGVVGADGTIASWTDAGSLLIPLAETTAATADDYLYIVGGCTGGNYCSTFSADVEVAKFQADGSLGPFALSTPLPGGSRWDAAAVTYRGSLYVLGGNDGYNPAPDGWVARIDPATGNLGAWQSIAPLPEDGGTAKPGVTVYHGVIYVAGGGVNRTGYTPDVWLGRIGADGLVASWTAGPPLPVAVNGPVAVALDESLYVMGGCNDDNGQQFCGNIYDSVWVAAILADGSLGPWSSTSSLTRRRTNFVAGVLGRWLLVTAGYTGNPVSTTEAARALGPGGTAAWTPSAPLPAPREQLAAASIGAQIFLAGGAGAALSVLSGTVDGGVVTAWSSGPALPAPRSALGLTASGTTLFAMGGADSSGQGTPDVWRWDVSSASASWLPVASLPAALQGLAAASSGGFVYAVGGVGSSAVYFAQAGDGGLSPWVATQPLPAERFAHAAVGYGGYLYAVAGQSGDAGLADILSAPIHADGTLGDWALAASLAAPRESVAAAAASGYLYVVGGQRVDGSPVDEVAVAPIHEDGTLGDVLPAFGLPAPVEHHAAVTAGGSLFVLGGRGSAPVATVVSTVLQTPAAIARYSLPIDLGSAVTLLDSILLTGTAAGLGFYDAQYRTAAPDGAYGPWLPLGPLQPGTDTPLGESGVRYVWLDLVFDDRLAAGRDAASIERDLTGVTLSLHP